MMNMIITKLPINPLLLLRRKRYYGVVAKDVELQMGATRMVSESQSSSAKNDNKNKDEIFWMRDPKSGNWIPENHFDEQVDAADLRSKFLSQQQNQHSNTF
ncbi:hypothetical protein Ahy_A02g009549 [Arachis hypogaea]|uniref:Uncharacterized protein n=1 Tax=Arachis hypogaea TaxID=3818 RepID=A0A445EHC6_ARAHY|nr:hypothetical protein Ahy_A02g009549 [Arachis hypogaea]